jgi:hypothetical protein
MAHIRASIIKFPNDIVIITETGNPGVFLADINVRALVKRVDELEKIAAKQADLINALWYHPGMPGHTESIERLGLTPQKK